MCHQPTKEENARNEARRALTDEDPQVRHDPWTYPEPRGNGEADEGELERSTEKLATVLGH